MTVGTSDAALDAAAARVAAAVATLRGSGRTALHRTELKGAAAFGGTDSHVAGSPQLGSENPLAPPVDLEIVDGRVFGNVTFRAPYEGPPGYVHGGVLASVFDELLGIANITGESPGMTAKLTVRYRRPTALHRPAEFEAWHERRQGRRLVAHATLRVDGELTAEAEGLFVGIDAQLAEEYFGALRKQAEQAGQTGQTGQTGQANTTEATDS